MYNILNVPSSGYSVLLNILNANKQKKVVLDPLTTVARLALLNFQEPGTKLGIDENKIVYYSPNMMQGLSRFIYGDKRGDLSNLVSPIQKAVRWYNPYTNPEQEIFDPGENNENAELVKQNIELMEKNFPLQIIFQIAHQGLVKLKTIYSKNQTDSDNPTYILLTIVDNILTGKSMELHDSITPEIASEFILKKKMDDVGDTCIHKDLQSLWTEGDIKIVCELLKKIQEEDNIDLKQNCIKTLDTFLSGKERTVTQIISRYTTKL